MNDLPEVKPFWLREFRSMLKAAKQARWSPEAAIRL